MTSNETCEASLARSAALRERLDDALANAWREQLLDACGCRRGQQLLLARAKLKSIARLCHDASVCLDRPVVRQAGIEARAERTLRRVRGYVGAGAVATGAR